MRNCLPRCLAKPWLWDEQWYILNIFGYDLSKLFFLSSCETQNNEQDQRTAKANQQRRNCSFKSRKFTDRRCVVKGTNSLPRQTNLYNFNKSRSNLASLLLLRFFFSPACGRIFTYWSELKVEETVEGSSLQFFHFFAHPSWAFEASEIAVLMADKRLWKDLVVARLRATKWVCECDRAWCMRTWGMKLNCFSDWCRGYQIKPVTVSTHTAACVAVISVSLFPRGRSGGDAWGHGGEGGRGRLVTLCFTAPSPLLLLLFFALPCTSPTSPCFRS